MIKYRGARQGENMKKTKKPHLSQIEIGYRDHDNLNVQGGPSWTLTDKISYDEPCIFILGGNGTRANMWGANGYAARIKQELAKTMDAQSVENLKVYGAAYDFGYVPIETDDKQKIPSTKTNFFFWQPPRKMQNRRQSNEEQTHDDDLAERLKFQQYGHKEPEFFGSAGVPEETNKQLDEIEGMLALWPLFIALDSIYADYIGYMLQRLIDTVLMDTIKPQYIKQLFDALILPRISEDGKKLDKNEAIKRIRNLTIWAHCHGAYVFLSLEELMQQKMAELGYTPSEMRDIQKQLFCVAFAPMMPLDASKSTVLSFASMYDRFLTKRHSNIFTYYIDNYKSEIAAKDKQHGMTDKASTEKDISYLVENPENNQIAYFPKAQGNIFIFPHLGDNFDNENLNDGRTLTHSEHNLEYKEKNPYAKIWRIFMANALGNSLKSAVDGTPIPDVKDLVTKTDYKNLKITDVNNRHHARSFVQLDEEMNAEFDIEHPAQDINEKLLEFYGIYEPQKNTKQQSKSKQYQEHPSEQMLELVFDTAKQNGTDIYNKMKTLHFIKGQGTIKQQIGTMFLQDNYFMRQKNEK